MADDHLMIDVAGRQVRLSNPDKVFFPEIGVTKLGLVEYYLAVADAALTHLRERPTVMKRYVNGAAGEPFFQKRVPSGAPEWLETATVSFPSGRTATELCPNDAAHLADQRPQQVLGGDLRVVAFLGLGLRGGDRLLRLDGELVHAHVHVLQD